MEDMSKFYEVLHGLKFGTKLRKNAMCFGFSFIFATKFQKRNANRTLSPKIQAHLQG